MAAVFAFNPAVGSIDAIIQKSGCHPAVPTENPNNL